MPLNRLVEKPLQHVAGSDSQSEDTFFAEHTFSLGEALSAAGDRPQRIVRADFIVQPFPAP